MSGCVACSLADGSMPRPDGFHAGGVPVQFVRAELPPAAEVEAVAERARRRFATATGSLRPP